MKKKKKKKNNDHEIENPSKNCKKMWRNEQHKHPHTHTHSNIYSQVQINSVDQQKMIRKMCDSFCAFRNPKPNCTIQICKKTKKFANCKFQIQPNCFHPLHGFLILNNFRNTRKIAVKICSK